MKQNSERPYAITLVLSFALALNLFSAFLNAATVTAHACDNVVTAPVVLDMALFFIGLWLSVLLAKALWP